MSEEVEKNGKYFGSISSDFVKVADTLKESSYQIRKAGFLYPVFPVCKTPLSIGRILIEKEALGLAWDYYASFLNEFVQRGLVAAEKEETFKQVYKDPDEFCCLFVVDQDFTKFVYIPYPID